MEVRWSRRGLLAPRRAPGDGHASAPRVALAQSGRRRAGRRCPPGVEERRGGAAASPACSEKSGDRLSACGSVAPLFSPGTRHGCQDLRRRSSHKLVMARRAGAVAGPARLHAQDRAAVLGQRERLEAAGGQPVQGALELEARGVRRGRRGEHDRPGRALRRGRQSRRGPLPEKVELERPARRGRGRRGRPVVRRDGQVLLKFIGAFKAVGGLADRETLACGGGSGHRQAPPTPDGHPSPSPFPSPSAASAVALARG